MEINVVIHYIDMYCFYRVSECKDCKMPSSNLAKVFGPTVIGYSVPDPEPLQMINETKYQAMVSYPQLCYHSSLYSYQGVWSYFHWVLDPNWNLGV